MNKNFIKNGYIVLRNAFPLKLHKEMQALVLNILSKKYKSNNYQEFCSQIKNKKNNLFELNKKIHSIFIYEKIFQKMFTNKKYFSVLSSLLGKDLSFLDEPSIVVNIPQF